MEEKFVCSVCILLDCSCLAGEKRSAPYLGGPDCDRPVSEVIGRRGACGVGGSGRNTVRGEGCSHRYVLHKPV